MPLPACPAVFSGKLERALLDTPAVAPSFNGPVNDPNPTNTPSATQHPSEAGMTWRITDPAHLLGAMRISLAEGRRLSGRPCRPLWTDRRGAERQLQP